MNSNFRNLALWAIIGVMLIALFNLFQNPAQQSRASEVAYSKFLDEVENNNVKSVEIAGRVITGIYSDNDSRFETYAPDDPELVSKLEQRGVVINASPPNEGSSVLGMFISWLPMFIILGVWMVSQKPKC